MGIDKEMISFVKRKPTLQGSNLNECTMKR